MPELLDVQQVGEVSHAYTPKQLLGRLKTFEDLSDVVLYVPFVYNLIRDRQRTKQFTDVFSHSLMQVLGNHPLIITDIETQVFETMPPIVLASDLKAAERTIYITPKTAWETLAEQLQVVTAIDKATQRFCVFRMYEEEIPCPIGNYADKNVKVWFCNLYGNRETYYFVKGTSETGITRMRLHYAPPIKEFVDLGNRLLSMFSAEKTEENAYSRFVAETQDTASMLQSLAIQKRDKLDKAIAAKPLEESQLTAKQRADCYEMIRLYHQLYLTNST